MPSFDSDMAAKARYRDAVFRGLQFLQVFDPAQLDQRLEATTFDDLAVFAESVPDEFKQLHAMRATGSLMGTAWALHGRLSKKLWDERIARTQGPA